MKKIILAIMLIAVSAYAIDAKLTSRDGSVVLDGFSNIIGKINGTEKIRVNSSGNVGIGATTIPFRLVAATTGTDGFWANNSSTTSKLGLGGYSAAGDGAFQILYDRATGIITFNGGSRDTPTERMRITVTGYLKVDVSNNIVGSDGTANAAAGNVGEYLEAIVSAGTNYPASTVWGDLTSLTLTAGDWDVTLKVQSTATSLTTTIYAGISTSSGATSGLSNNPLNYAQDTLVGSIAQTHTQIVSVRVRVSASTTYYAKYNATYSSTAPTALGVLSARRVR